LLLPHPATIATAAATATSVTIGKRMSLMVPAAGCNRGRVRPLSSQLLLTNRVRIGVPQSGDPSPPRGRRPT
jgi:hypothetical protein